MPENPKLTVLGAGSWGTALAALCARNGVPTTLWGRDREALAALAANRRNQRYLPDVELPAELACESDLACAVHGADIVLIVVPSHAFAAMLAELAPLLDAGTAIAWATKGFEPGTGRFLHELVAERLPGRPAAVVTGPSFAKEVAAGLPSAVTVHSDDAAFAQQLASLLHAPNLRAYSGGDVLGAELGGAMKNVLAVATGIADGMQLGLNARAGLITRGMNEMLRLGMALGARPETLIGLSGLGDLVLTCGSPQSRNMSLGRALGQGQELQTILAGRRSVAEGVYTAAAVVKVAAERGVDMPISAAVYAIVEGRQTVDQAIEALLSRPLRAEG